MLPIGNEVARRRGAVKQLIKNNNNTLFLKNSRFFDFFDFLRLRMGVWVRNCRENDSEGVNLNDRGGSKGFYHFFLED